MISPLTYWYQLIFISIRKVFSTTAKDMATKIMEITALDNHSFSIAEDEGFCYLIHHLEVRLPQVRDITSQPPPPESRMMKFAEGVGAG